MNEASTSDPSPPGEASTPHANFAECEARLLEALNRNIDLRREIAVYKDALRPFAEAYRRTQAEGVTLSKYYARAAELVPPNT